MPGLGPEAAESVRAYLLELQDRSSSASETEESGSREAELYEDYPKPKEWV